MPQCHPGSPAFARHTLVQSLPALDPLISLNQRQKATDNGSSPGHNARCLYTLVESPVLADCCLPSRQCARASGEFLVGDARALERCLFDVQTAQIAVVVLLGSTPSSHLPGAPSDAQCDLAKGTAEHCQWKDEESRQERRHH